jgi:16S rRNA C967 or C1407 C5-methylase (RsmB/RsmF family)
MGIFDFFKKKVTRSDKLNEIADEYLKNNLHEHAEIMKVAGKITRADLMKKQAQQMKSIINQGLNSEEDDDEEDDESDEEEEEEVPEFLQPFVKNLLNKSGLGGASSLSTSAPPQISSDISPLKKKAFELIAGMSDADLMKNAKHFI